MTNALIVQDEKSVELVRSFETRIAQFLPGGNTLPAEVRLGMAQIAIAHGLDPWLREVWPIPNKDKQGNVTGWSLMVGITGWRSNANRSGEYWGRRFEKCTQEERDWLRAGPRDIAIKCFVLRRKTGSHPIEFDGYGLYRDGEYTKMNPLFAARLRAERDAMKAAFPISAPAGIDLKYGDENGEEINGYHGTDWEQIKDDSASVTGYELQDRLTANRKALGRDDGDLIIASRESEPITAEVVSDEQANKAAEFPEAATKFDAPVPVAQNGNGDAKAAFESYADSRNWPDFKRLAVLDSAGGDYATALEFARKIK